MTRIDSIEKYNKYVIGGGQVYLNNKKIELKTKTIEIVPRNRYDFL